MTVKEHYLALYSKSIYASSLLQYELKSLRESIFINYTTCMVHVHVETARFRLLILQPDM